MPLFCFNLPSLGSVGASGMQGVLTIPRAPRGNGLHGQNERGT